MPILAVRIGSHLDAFAPEISYAVSQLCACVDVAVDFGIHDKPVPSNSIGTIYYGVNCPLYANNGGLNLIVGDSGFFKSGFFLRPDSVPSSVQRISQNEVSQKVGQLLPEDDFISLFKGIEECSVKKDERQIPLPWDIIASAFYLLTGYEDYVISERDEHGRLLHDSCIASRFGFEERPLVDEYRYFLSALLGLPQVEGIGPGFILTVDVDHLTIFRNKKQILRSIAADVLKRKNPLLALRRIYYEMGNKEEQDIAGIFALATFGREYSIPTMFNFMAAEPGFLDSGYDINAPDAKDIVSMLRDMGCTIGFHPGYGAGENRDAWMRELNRLRNAVGEPIVGGRQHYLRSSYPSTWRLYADSGLALGSNMAFSESAGFRAGTAGVFQTWDILQRKELNHAEQPLVFMDDTYRHRIDEGWPVFERLYRRSQKYGHRMTTLFHNTSLIDPFMLNKYAEAKREWLNRMRALL